MTAWQFEFALALSLNPSVVKLTESNVKSYPRIEERIDYPGGGYETRSKPTKKSIEQFERFSLEVKKS